VSLDLPSEADELYALDPADFTAARNELVRALKSEGRRDEAAVVARLRRPTPAAWALNQVARDEPGLLDAAVEAGHRLHEATEAAVGGKGDALRAAMAGEQAASGEAVEAAMRHLGERGAELSPRLAGTLRAAALDDDVADQLRRGVLSTDHEASGFGFARGFEVGPTPKKAPRQPRSSARAAGSAKAAAGSAKAAAGGEKPPRSDQDEVKARRKAEQEDRRRRRAELRAKVDELRDQAAALDKEAKGQEAAARKARAEAERAAAKLDQARQDLDRLKSRD
jgi:hypothetical protein